MQEFDDITLLREYSQNHSEEAFEILVSRHLRLVYAAALRQTGNPQLADEVTQTVFIILAEKAAGISQGTLLSGWLFRTTRFVVLAQSRTQRDANTVNISTNSRPFMASGGTSLRK